MTCTQYLANRLIEIKSTIHIISITILNKKGFYISFCILSINFD